MKNREELNKELGELSPFLSEMKNKSEGFKVPDNYFAGLSDEVWQRLQAEQQAARPVPGTPAPALWWQQLQQAWQLLLQPRYALALASVAVVISVAIFLFRPAGNADAPIAQISVEEAHQYVSLNIDEFDTSLLAELASNTEEDNTRPAVQAETPNDSVMDQYLEEMIDEIDLEDLEDLL